ncbi:Katanin p60 ATPase-containing subunit A-like 2 [Senna tora]|uniref:Katanin p60 ATPase-containing subunit A-like 2 n=1 Tax=Senna tora TaxID=362788 RepID=A0A834X8Z0_9FABA|nr:Katanin p60 ATPase-containing subunit A-like 2 [Senna tora]
MADVPLPTRWSFQDFRSIYDAKFNGKKILENGDKTVSNGSNSGATSNGSNHAKSTSDMAIYEQFQSEGQNSTHSNGFSPNNMDGRPQKSLLPSFESADMRALGESLSRDIIRGSPDVKWESIKGLENAKRLLKEAVVMPIKYPKYFTGLLSPWKGILLFGPPGTGKTMLAKAVATECNTTFFNISASSVVSKWRGNYCESCGLPYCLVDLEGSFAQPSSSGYALAVSDHSDEVICRKLNNDVPVAGRLHGFQGDSEKLVKVLFELARHHAPSTIFLDEIDAIISQRGEARSEHEASRRLKTELLIQMDGLTRTNDLVFVLAATNLPWELDAAMLRRLEKRILVPLPEPEARRAMFEELLPSHPNEDLIPYDIMVEQTEGYSGSDIRLLCKEAAMQPLRRLMSQLEERQEVVPEEELPKVGPIRPEDIGMALKNTRPSAHLHAHKYEKFNADYGSQILQ